MRIRDEIEMFIGKASIMQLINNPDNPITIIGFLPILSERDPRNGEEII